MWQALVTVCLKASNGLKLKDDVKQGRLKWLKMCMCT